MSRKPILKPHPNGNEYLITLAGCVLLAGDVIFGNPADTTPQGRTNAMRLVERTMQEAEQHGFTQTSAVWALMRRNDQSPRLVNLVQDAVDRIPNEAQGQIMRDTMSMANEAAPGLPLVTAMKSSVQHEPETNPRFTRPGTDGIDPRFLEAGHELQRIAKEEGDDAIHKPEHAHLYMKMFRYAPKDLREEMEAKAKELGLLPKATHVGEDGQPVFSKEQLAQKHGMSTEEVEQFIAQAGIDPDDLYNGPVFPIQ